MNRARSLGVALLMLLCQTFFTTSAAAECAWVLWVSWFLPDAPSHLATGTIPVGGYTTKDECERRAPRGLNNKRSTVLFSAFPTPSTRAGRRGSKGARRLLCHYEDQ